MNERNWQYKGLQLSNRMNPYNFQVSEVVNEITYEARIFQNQNSDGVYSSNVMTGARFFEFTGRIFWTKAEKELAYAKIKEAIRSEDFPGLLNRGFYPLRWTDKRGQDVEIMAKVYRPFTTSESKFWTLIFKFTLLADQPIYYSVIESRASWGIGNMGGNAIPNTIPNILNTWENAIIVENHGDKKAPIFIQIIGNIENPRITNYTTGQSLKILKTTQVLMVDNTKKPFMVSDGTQNIKVHKRGDYIYLAPWQNRIIVSIEGGDPEASVLIKYRDHYE